MNESKCRTRQELSDYLLGKLTSTLLDEVAEHVDECGECQSTVVMLAEHSDTFVAGLRSPPAADSLEQEAEAWLAQANADGANAEGANAAEAPADAHQIAGNDAASMANPAGTSQHLRSSKRAATEIDKIGPYEIVGRVGVGGMGTVFEAVHSKLKRTVALKILPASRWASASAIARFEREMEVIGQLNHPNIVHANDAGEDDGMHYLVMEHVDGLDLSRLVVRVGPLSVADACEIARQAAVGLQYAAERHLVHRDIKPSNVMLQMGGRAAGENGKEGRVQVKILDLGLALLGEGHAGHENELTTVGQLMGTLDYMSPEQGMDSHDVDSRSDIYSLGATLYKLLTGKAPFTGPQYNTLLKKVSALANHPSPSIHSVRPNVPAELAAVVDRMLAKEPALRYSCPQEVVDALTPFSSGADLKTLLDRGLAANAVADESPQWPIDFRGGSPEKPETVRPKPATSPARRRPRNILVATGLVFLVGLAAAIVVYLATNRGELVVRAEADARIVIRSNGKSVSQLEVHRGDNEIQVRSGQYTIELQGQSDSLELSRQAVSIRRGEQVVVRVWQRGKEDANAPSEGAPVNEMADTTSAWDAMWGAGEDDASDTKPEATYDAKTYSQWLAELATERKPERLTEAIQAFAALGEDDTELARESSVAILRLMRRYGSRILGTGPRWILTEKAVEVLKQMPPDVVLRSLADEVTNGTTRSRAFVNYFLLQTIDTHGRGGQTEFGWALQRNDRQLTQLLVNLSLDEVPAVRADALSLVIRIAKQNGEEVEDIKGLLPRLRQGLASRDKQMLAVATSSILEFDTDHEQLVPALVRLVEPADPFSCIGAIAKLGELGPRAEPAVSKLVAVLTTLQDPKQTFPSANFFSGMAGGGMGMGGGGMGGRMGGGGMGGGGMGGYRPPSADPFYVTIETLGLIGPAATPALPALAALSKTAERGTFQMIGGRGWSMGSYSGVLNTATARIEGRPVEEVETPPAPGGIF